ncbi:hypothetical protein BXP70_26205 [Hymenobacter crusticola]|uniref:DUF4249 domain-containing protein n=1 Tax=Hymenobacter crusticola TaxID=1770526 RepID=A0A243W6F3_9BACT|nr:hypothetical protein BXP70_26205 [Hymenobacter crusticola]
MAIVLPNYWWGILLLAFSSGCTDQMSADLPPPAPTLVVNSILTPDSAFQVQVSRVSRATDSASRLLSSARVQLLTPGQGTQPSRCR